MNSYKKLDDGSFGVLCDNFQSPGDVVTVTTKDGRQRQETLGAEIGSWKRFPIYAIEPRTGTAVDAANKVDAAKAAGRGEVQAVVRQARARNHGVRVSIISPRWEAWWWQR